MDAFYGEGRYQAEIVNQALGKNPNTDTPQFVLKVRILTAMGGEGFKPVRQQYERTIYMYLSEKAAPYTIEKLQGIGFDKPSLRHLDLNYADPHDFRKQTVELICKHEASDNGDTREKWDLARVGNGDLSDVTPLEPAETRKLDALFGKSLAKAPAATKPAQRNTVSAPVAVAEQNNPDIDDSDIPF